MPELLPLPSVRERLIVVGGRNYSMSRALFLEMGKLELPFPEKECVLWNGHPGWDGYGKCYTGKGRGQSAANAHRICYQLFVGTIPPGLVIDHLCNNRRCVNPHHLQATTQSVNIGRALAVTHCPKGHPYSEENTRVSSENKKSCRQCERVRCLAYYYTTYRAVRAARRASRRKNATA